MIARISTHIASRELQAYCRKLLGAGFNLLVATPRKRVDGKPVPVDWLLYEKDGNVGVVEKTLGGYTHAMPVHPTRENGSAIVMFDNGWALHVTHAEKTAQPENRGRHNGNMLFKNEGMTDYRRKNYLPLEDDVPVTVPVTVVWQEIRQYVTVMDLEVKNGQLGSKEGRAQLRAQVDEKLDSVDLESDELLDESWHGPHRHIEKMEPIWDAVEPAKAE